MNTSLPKSTSRENVQVKMEFGMLGGKPKDPKKNLGTRTRANKRLNPHVMLGLGIETGPTVVEASAVTSVP